MDAIVLCDAKFGPGAIQAAIDYLTVEERYRVLAAALISRKVPEGFELEVPVVAAPDAETAVRHAAEEFGPQVVVDVTESPLEDRFRWVNEAFQLGLEVHGADYSLRPPRFAAPPGVPVITFAGAGPAAGKTAAIVHCLGELKAGYKPAAVVLDIGGPSYPELLEPISPETAVERLYGFHREGRRVYGDHYSIAASCGVTSVGCSFAGTGLTGVPLNSIFKDGLILAADAGADFVLVEGSGLALLPVAAAASCFLVSVRADASLLKTFTHAYHVRMADLILVTGFGDEPAPAAYEEIHGVLRAMNRRAPVHYASLQPALVGETRINNALVITAKPEAVWEKLKVYWARELAGSVLDVLSAEKVPPPPAIVKQLKQSRNGTGLLLDMGAATLGEWLTWANDWDFPAALTYEILKPPKHVFAAVIAKAEEDVRRPA